MAANETRPESTPAQPPTLLLSDGADMTPVLLRVEIGRTDDVLGTIDLHVSGALTYTFADARYQYTIVNTYIRAWTTMQDATPAAVLRAIPEHVSGYNWARVVFDHTPGAV